MFIKIIIICDHSTGIKRSKDPLEPPQTTLGARVYHPVQSLTLPGYRIYYVHEKTWVGKKLSGASSLKATRGAQVYLTPKPWSPELRTARTVPPDISLSKEVEVQVAGGAGDSCRSHARLNW